MTTAAVHGKSGKVSLGGAEVLEVTNWAMARPTEVADATSFTSAGDREFITGLKNRTGTFTCLRFQQIAGSTLVGTFQVGASAASNQPTFAGSVIITDEPVTVPVDGRVQYEYAFQWTGTETVAVA